MHVHMDDTMHVPGNGNGGWKPQYENDAATPLFIFELYFNH